MKKRIINIVTGVFIASALFSCTSKEEDRVFEDTVNQRTLEAEKKLLDVLLSAEHGWKLVYFTDIERYGGYTFLMDFKDERNVVMASDFDEEGAVLQKGEYEVKFRSTVSLIFTTKNKIHDLSDPINSQYKQGEGYEGEYQFGFYGNTEDEIYFKTPKQGQEVVFVKATPEDWAKIGEQYEIAEKMELLDEPYFRVLNVKEGGQEKSYDIEYAASVRIVDIMNGSDLNDRSGFSINYVPGGMQITPAIKVGSTLVSNLYFDEAYNSFVFNDGVNTVSLEYSNEPINWEETYKELLAHTLPKRTFLFDPNDGALGSSSTSALFRQKVIELGRSESGKYDLEEIQIQFKDDGTLQANYADYQFRGVTYRFNFEIADGDRAIQIKNGKWDTATVPSGIRDLNNAIFANRLYLKLEKFRLRYTNPVITLIGDESPIAFSLWDLGEPQTF